MLLLSIVQTLDAELDRLKRLREIVAALETAPPGAVNSDGVAALLASAEEPAISSLREERATPEEQKRPAPASLPAAEPAPKRQKRSKEEAGPHEPMEQAAPRAVSASPSKADLRTKAEAEEDKISLRESVAPLPENDRRSAKPVPSPGAVDAKEPKPSMVVVSATEAARERASRLARVPAKRAPGTHPAPKPDAAPEDLARDLAARWLSSSSSSTELSDR